MFPLSTMPGMPSISSFKASTWTFETSEGGEFDALIFAAGKGSFYVSDSRDPDGIVHELLYVGAGVSKSKGPIPFGIGGSFSTPDMPSSGIGPIMMKPSKSSLELSDFGGSGLILTAAAGIGKGKDYAIILFGVPPFTVGAGRMEGIQYMAPGFGFTAMPCIFTVDP
jgi:hypothetical protein